MAEQNHINYTVKTGDIEKSASVTQHISDAPLLPVSDMERLQSLRPDLVDFVIKQTEIEANHRRTQENRTNSFIFTVQLLGQLLSLVVACVGIGGGIYAGIQGYEWLGGTIATVTIGTLAVAYLRTGR